MATTEGPSEPPVRRDVVDALRRQHHSWRRRKLLRTATQAELLTAALEALWDAPINLVEMADRTIATLPDDPDWE